MNIVGVDPGIKGGLSCLELSTKGLHRLARAVPMPTLKVGKSMVLDTRELDDFFPAGDAFVFIENVHSYPKQGVVSTFQFGRIFGNVEATMQLFAGVSRIEYVQPQAWKAEFDLIGEDKVASIEKATQLFGPKGYWRMEGPRGGSMIEANSGVAEATLIAEYGRRYMEELVNVWH